MRAALCFYNYITIGESSGTTKAKADVTGDGSVNASDIVAIYNYIANGNKTARTAKDYNRRPSWSDGLRLIVFYCCTVKIY